MGLNVHGHVNPTTRVEVKDHVDVNLTNLVRANWIAFKPVVL
jgi:hypothetical protein